MMNSYTDIHCHILPGIDDGARDWDESLAMARMAVEDGTSTIVATPHQLGNFGENHGDEIRRRAAELQARLDDAGIPLRILPGADVRIDPAMTDQLLRGAVLTLGDHRRHVLLELPHEIYLPLESVLDELDRHRMIGILSHPERNEGILRQPELISPLVEAGCLLQITAASLCGTFGPECQECCEWLLSQGFVHFIASDGHGVRSRRPVLRRAYERTVKLTDQETADALCRHNPAAVAAGRDVASGRRPVPRRPSRWWARRPVA